MAQLPHAAETAGSDDPELARLQKIDCMVKAMNDFTCHVRSGEGFLSIAQIFGSGTITNEHNKLVHEIALARQAFDMDSHRESRFKVWSQWTDACVKKVLTFKLGDPMSHDKPLASEAMRYHASLSFWFCVNVLLSFFRSYSVILHPSLCSLCMPML